MSVNCTRRSAKTCMNSSTIANKVASVIATSNTASIMWNTFKNGLLKDLGKLEGIVTLQEIINPVSTIACINISRVLSKHRL
ncbi:conserved hypothetical protein [Vibrio coralliirubri]|nr:conserved hypothetical protein [Vibrio coralliirubri]CDT92950.1 conserved hypothetical protein [Vibrio coralliirubri]